MRVAIFGGSFNPPHVGHVLAAAYVLACAPIDRVLVVPTFRHPFGKPLTDFDDRVAMCRLAFADLPRAEVSDVEATLGGASLTVRTLAHLQAANPSWRMRLVVGADVLAELSSWSEPERVRALAPLLPLARAGHPTPAGAATYPAVLPDVSSTEMRAALASGDRARVEPWLPGAVVDYAIERGLYRPPTADRARSTTAS